MKSQTKLIAVTSVFSLGGTFLEWSINFLCGKTQYHNHKLGPVELTANPLLGKNAHSHKKNHPLGLLATCDMVESMIDQTDFISLYPAPMPLFLVAENLGITTRENFSGISTDQWQKILQYQTQDYNQSLSWLAGKQGKIVFIDVDQSMSLYTKELRNLEQLWYTDQVIPNADNHRLGFDLVFFQESHKHWQRLGLTDKWDIRERLALSMRPFELTKPAVDLSIPHYWIDSRELWFDGWRKMPDIIAWLELDLDQSRWDQWAPVYQKWQQTQVDSLKFQFTYQHIVDAIVNGWSYPIDLSFDQEIIIQHLLIYNHNLNLKTWQLENFPNNTKLLHELLEPNIHPI